MLHKRTKNILTKKNFYDLEDFYFRRGFVFFSDLFPMVFNKLLNSSSEISSAIPVIMTLSSNFVFSFFFFAIIKLCNTL